MKYQNMKYIDRISGKISLFCYILMLYQLWHLCQYGGIRRHLPALVAEAAVCGITFALWLITRWRLKKNPPKANEKPKMHSIEILTFVVATIFFCGCIVYAAIPYHGALSWKLDELRHKREVAFEHTNVFEDGVEGILSDLDKALDLPKELYVSGSFQVTFDAAGTVQNIDTVLYGKNTAGQSRTYLITYDVNQSDRMTVWLDVHADESYEEEMRLSPMLRILEHAKWQREAAAWAETDRDQQYELYYAGRRAFAVEDGLRYLPGDADGDGRDTGKNCMHQLCSGGMVEGFEVSLYIPESERVSPVRYLMEPMYITQEAVSGENMLQQIEKTKESWTVDQRDGSVYFFLDDFRGWRLSIADAAAGSRFYILEKTEDGGASWEVLNKNPFLGQAGVAEGLMFYDENLGVAGLSGASQTTSVLYLTRDGGMTFQEIRLPMDRVPTLPEIAEEYGWTIEDYDYLNMPEMHERCLKITVVTEAMEEHGIVFESIDHGDTWVYAGD